MKYSDFIKQKIAVSKLGGFDVPESELPECLMPHQKDIVRWAVRGGQRAVFASFGLGKTLIQIFGRITIETDVVRENNQTYRLGWTECCKDGSKMGVGCPEYLLLFRKLPTDHSRGYADFPVTHTKAEYSRGRWQIDARAKWNSSGNRLLTDDEIAGYVCWYLHPEKVERGCAFASTSGTYLDGLDCEIIGNIHEQEGAEK